MILTRSTRLSQPQGPVEIDWSNPLTSGLTRVLRCQGAQLIDMLTPAGESSGITETGTFLAQVNPGGFGRRNNSTTRANYTLVQPKTETMSSVTIVWSGVVNVIGGQSYPFFRNAQTQVFAAGTGNAFWGTRFGNATNRVSTTAIKLRTPTTYLFTQSGAIGSLFVDGNAALLNVSGASGGAFPSPHAIDANQGFTQSNDITTNVMLIYNRPMSAQEAASLSANPWQLFRPVQRRVYFDMGAGGGTTHTVTADPIEQGSTTTRPGLTQTHITTARSVAQGATVSRSAITQTHVVEARPNLQASIVALPLVTQTHVVTARAVAQGSTVNAPAVDVGSITVVTARPVVQSSTVNAPSIVQTHAVTARPVAHSSTVTRPGLTQTHTVTARAVTQGSVVNAPSVDVGSTPATFVTARPAAQGSTVNAPGIRQTHVTSARAVVHGSTINVPGLVQTHMVTARPVVQASTVRVAGVAPPFVRSIYWAAVPSETFRAAVPHQSFRAAVPGEPQ